jgi:hypothetical protein
VFARSRSSIFDSLGSRRRRRRVPRRLLLGLCSLLAGGGGVLFFQQRVLPPRLSAEASEALRQDFELADAERRRLKADLVQVRQQVQRGDAERRVLDEQLAAAQALARRLRDDLAATVQALPPDPRAGSVEVRAGQFGVRAGALDYLVVLLREGRSSQPLNGSVQFTVSGESARGMPAALTLPPIALSMLGHEVLRGSLPLPEGFKPKQATVQVLDRAAGKPLGTRVLLVR